MAIINPTAFLGNLLIAGDLVRDFINHCHARHTRVLLVLDERFESLVGDLFDDAELVWYPRSRIKNSSLYHQARLFLSCLKKVRAFGADLAFNLEEDSVSSRLTQFSGAGFRLGCSPLRHRHGYERVLPILYTDRPAERPHRWHAYQEVFQALGISGRSPRYLQPSVSDHIPSLRDRLSAAGVPGPAELVTVHVGATKAYKKWPLENFFSLCEILIGKGYFPVLIGAGESDRRDTDMIDAQLVAAGHTGRYLNLCDQCSFPELAALFSIASAAVGNDSGPFHLAAAMNTPGVVLFGPSIQSLWQPLGDNSIVLHHNERCASDCNRHHCRLDFRCLKSITPEEVMHSIDSLSQRTATPAC